MNTQEALDAARAEPNQLSLDGPRWQTLWRRLLKYGACCAVEYGVNPDWSKIFQSFRRSPPRTVGHLHRVISWSCLDRLRLSHHRREAATDTLDQRQSGAASIEQHVGARHQLETLRACVDDLDPAQRRFALLIMSQGTTAEICRALEISPGTYYKRKQRLLLRLRHQMARRGWRGQC